MAGWTPRRWPITAPTSGRLWALVAALALVTVGCKEIPEGQAGTELRHGNLAVTVDGYELRYLDLQSETGAVVTTQDPVLVISLTVTNHGPAAIRYDTRDSTTHAQQALTPVLFVESGEDEDLTAANQIPMVGLGQYRYLDDPVSGPISIGSEETIRDLLLFEEPGEDAEALLLSLPPSMFGPDVELPAVIRIPYAAPEPQRPPVHDVGEVVSTDGYTFRVDRYEVAFLPNSDRSGFTERPVLAIHYTITNTGEEPLIYSPPHRRTTSDTAPSLSDGSRHFERVSLPPGQYLQDQLREVQSLAPGEELRDFSVFERPPQDAQLQYHFPAHNIGRNGLIRVRISYSYSDPPLPEELQEATSPPEEVEGAEGQPAEGSGEGAGDEGDASEDEDD